MHLSGTTVTADPTKGFIELYRDADQMMSFVWRNRVTNAVSPNDELVIVSGDYTWKRVHQCKSVAIPVLRSDFCCGSLMRDAAPAVYFCCLFTARRGSFGCKNQMRTRMPSTQHPALYACFRVFLTIATEFVPIFGARLGTPLLMPPLRLQQRKRRSPWRLAAALLAMMRLFMIRLLQIQVREHKFVVNGNLWARRLLHAPHSPTS